MSAQRDPDRLINAFLMEGQTELADQVYDAVRASIDHTSQRVVIGPWRMPDMNKLMPVALGAAAMVAALVIGVQVLGPRAPGGVGAAPPPSPTPTPVSTTWTGIPVGPFVVTGSGDPVRVTLDVTSPGWVALPQFDERAFGDSRPGCRDWSRRRRGRGRRCRPDATGRGRAQHLGPDDKGDQHGSGAECDGHEFVHAWHPPRADDDPLTCRFHAIADSVERRVGQLRRAV